MVNNSPSLKRGKRKLEPISIDELASDSTMTGFSDLFKIPTTFPQWSGVDTGGPETSAPETGPLVIEPRDHITPCLSSIEASGVETDPSVIAPVANEFCSESAQTGGLVSNPSLFQDPAGIDTAIGSETDPPETSGSVSGGSGLIVSAPLQRKLQIREAKSVQDGHTYGEQTVYGALWSHGTVVTEQMRVITIGFLRMTGIAGLAESNCKAAVAGLLDKLAIERLPDQKIALGRTYKVYSWTSVLSRRRAAGLTHVIKSRGVVFVDPKTGLRLTTAKTQPRRHKNTTTAALSVETGGTQTDGPVSVPPASPGEISELAARLRRDLDPALDDSAASRLWRECHMLVPDCTVDEILHFILLKSQVIYRDSNIKNPIGLLLMTIPEFFHGTAVHELRAQKGREEYQRRELQEQQQRYWQDVADNPGTPLNERQLALAFLAKLI